MLYISLAFAATLAITGCKKTGNAATIAPAGADCASVIPAAVDRVMSELAKGKAALPPEKIAQIGPKTKEVLLTRCAADEWPAAHLACIAAGKTNADMHACDEMLPEAAKHKLKAELHAAMKSIVGPPGLSGAPALGYKGTPLVIIYNDDGTPAAGGSADLPAQWQQTLGGFGDTATDVDPDEDMKKCAANEHCD